MPRELTTIGCAAALEPASGRLLRDCVIELEDGRIAGLREAADIHAADLVLEGKLVLPGLIDLHTHVIWSPGDLLRQFLTRTSAAKAIEGLRGAQTLLRTGFTTIRNLGDVDAACPAVDVRDAIARGEFPGPRMLVAPHLIGPPGGHCDFTELACDMAGHAFGRIVTGEDELRRAVREEIKQGADWIKLCATGGVTTQDDPRVQALTDEELAAAVSEAHRHGKPVAAHAHGGSGIAAAVRACADTVEHASLVDAEAIELMRERGTLLVPTMYVIDHIVEHGRREGLPEDRVAKAVSIRAARDERLRAAVAAGVRVGFGTDSGPFPHGLGVREFGCLMRIGLTPLQAVQAATSVAAECLGLQGEIGTLESGACADLVAVDADPREDVTTLERVRFVMRDGVVVRHDGAGARA